MSRCHFIVFKKENMHKIIDVKLTSIFSPVCQTLIHENTQQQVTQSKGEWLNNCAELLVIRLDGTVIAYGTFEIVDDINISVNSLHFRDIIKDHTLGEYWLSRQLKRYLRNNTYLNFLLAS